MAHYFFFTVGDVALGKSIDRYPTPCITSTKHSYKHTFKDVKNLTQRIWAANRTNTYNNVISNIYITRSGSIGNQKEFGLLATYALAVHVERGWGFPCRSSETGERRDTFHRETHSSDTAQRVQPGQI